MGFHNLLHTTAAFAPPTHFDDFRKQVEPAWIEAALAQTGTSTIRRRRLPADQVLWVVLGMSLFRDKPMEDVVSKLELALPGKAGTIARSSVSQARARVGSAPMKWLFERSASVWSERSADTHRWRGLHLYGIDGSTVRVPDTAENRAEFGGQKLREGSESGYPLVRIVALMVLRSHILRAVHVGRYEGTHEVTFAKELVPSIPEQSLTIVDRAFLGAPLLLALEKGADRHWLARAKSTTKTALVERFADGDELVEMKMPASMRAEDPELSATWTARRIRYQRPGFREQWLLTSLKDPVAYPAAEVAALYHERWELELGYDEIKTELLAREETIRSKKPDGVRQELYGVLLVYNLVRLEMQSIARDAKLEPTRISFVESLRLMRDEWWWMSVASPGAIPKRIAAMRASIKRYLLPPRRARSYPRAVKMKLSGYPSKNRVAAK